MTNSIKPIIIYYDNNGNIVSKEEATKCEILEYDEMGNFKGVTIGKIEKTADEEPEGMGSI